MKALSVLLVSTIIFSVALRAEAAVPQNLPERESKVRAQEPALPNWEFWKCEEASVVLLNIWRAKCHTGDNAVGFIWTNGEEVFIISWGIRVEGSEGYNTSSMYVALRLEGKWYIGRKGESLLFAQAPDGLIFSIVSAEGETASLHFIFRVEDEEGKEETKNGP